MPRIKKSSGKSRMWAAALGAVALAVMGVGAFAVPAPASATDSGACVPSAAWDETVVDKAAWTEVIPAVTQTIHHDAVTHTAYQRYSWTGGPIESAPSEVPPGPDWQANTTNYEGAGHGTDPVNQPFQQGKPGNGDWFYWTATEVVDQPASDEVVVVTPEQTIEHPAITHVVHHDAVTCPPPDGWTPKSSVVLLAADCYAGGTNVAGLVSDSLDIASGEQLVSITFNGSPVGEFGPMVSAAGTYTYSYVIKNTATGETYTSPDKTVTIEACTVTPPIIKVDVPSVPNVCAPNYTLPDDTEVLSWSISHEVGLEGHLIVTIKAENTTFQDGTTTHDYGRVPVGECGTTPSVTTFTVTWPDAVCVAGANNDRIGSPVVSPADAATVTMGTWDGGKLTNKVTAVNDSFIPGEGVELEKTYADDGGNCGAVTPPPVVTPPAPPVAPAVDATPVDASPLTGIDAPSTGGRGDTSSPLNGWIGGVILSILAAGAVAGGIIKVRRRRA